MNFQMQSIDNNIISNVKKCGRGKVVFASDFIRLGESKAVNKTLERLVQRSVLIRIAMP